MNILFMGSVPTYQHEETREMSQQELPYVHACEELGFVAASRGHTLLLGDDDRACADRYVMQGAMRFASESANGTVSVQLNRPEGSQLVFDDVPSNVEVNRVFHQELDRAMHGTGSLIPNLAALESSDVLVIIGGKLTAKLLGNIAVDKDKPLLAIPSFGGSSNELYDRLRYLYKSALKERFQDLTLLQTVWRDDSAGKIIDLAEALAVKERIALPAHAYFISYTWDESAQADHVEVLLHRNGRRVNRDEAIFRAGTDLSDVVKSLINESDTFIGLWSEKFKQSTWCPSELEYARQRMKRGDKPSRVVLLSVDDFEPPITFTDNIRLTGIARDERELALRKLIEQEESGDSGAA